MNNLEQNSDYEPIAVIGMSCRFPGAENPAQFWDNLVNGIESKTQFSRSELRSSGLPDEVLDAPNCVGVACCVKDTDRFDADFFGYSPLEARMMDPQQRLFLECSWHAFEDAGYRPGKVRDRVGVFGGSRISTYMYLLVARPYLMPQEASGSTALAFQSLISNDKDYLASRVAYKLGLTGPAITLQTACSTSLVAVHMACQSIQLGECDLALAGGSALLFPQETAYLSQEGMILSPTGCCRPFDAKADGTIMGHGTGVVLLKRLSDALRDEDRIYAVIRGSAVNNDGNVKAGYTAPGFAGQSGVVSEALALSGLPAETIGYVETHGTGTLLGDPMEVAALTAAFRQSTTAVGFCRLGAVKANIGHLDTAAGIAGFIKAVMAVREGVIPPLANFNEHNPHIDFQSSPFTIPIQRTPWDSPETPRRAGISSFGIGGTNCHIVIEEYPNSPANKASVHSIAGQDTERLNIFTLSAQSTESLKEYATLVAASIANSSASLNDLCFTSREGRVTMPYRLAIPVASKQELSAGLKKWKKFENGGQVPAKKIIPAFLFTGQGSQYPTMGRILYESSPIFATYLDDCSDTYKRLTACSLLELIFSEDPEAIRSTAAAQPALFAIEYALARTMITLGITPKAMLGHSIGEYAAACVAGVFSPDEAMRLVTRRGELMASLPENGAMAAVFASEHELDSYLEVGADVEIAALNAPAQTVLSGKKEAVRRFLQRLDDAGIAYKELFVSNGFHSQLMEPILESFRAEFEHCTLQAPTIPFISNVTGKPIEDAQATDPDYWVKQLRSGVRFMDGLSSLESLGANLFIECGPHPVLSGLVQAHPSASKHPSVFLMQKGSKDLETFYQALCRLFVQGETPEWSKMEALPPGFKTEFPVYPFQRKRYWPDTSLSAPASCFAGIKPIRFEGTATQEEIFGETLLYRHLWVEENVEPAPTSKWLLLANDQELTMAEAVLGEHKIASCHDHTGDWENILLIAPDKPDDTASGKESSYSSLTDVLSGFSSKLLETASLLESRPKSRLVVITRNGKHKEELGDSNTNFSPNLAHAAMAAMVRVFQHEYPQFATALLIEGATSYSPFSFVAACTKLIPAESRLEGAMLYVPQLAKENRQLKTAEALFNPNATYLITGGTGDIATCIAVWLASRGAKHIALVGRRQPPERDLLAESVEAMGGKIYRLRCDLSSAAQVNRLLKKKMADLPKLKGVFHLAGSIADKLLATLQPEDLEKTLAAKVFSAANLLDQTENLDFMLCFSSISAIFGFDAQAAYSAANAALEALCIRHKAKGVPVSFVRWGAWGVGPGKDKHVKDVLAAVGLGVLPPVKALAGMDVIMGNKLSYPVLMKANSEIFAPLAGISAAGVKATGATPAAALSKDKLLEIILKEIQSLLEMDKAPAKDANLLELGLDSLIFLTLSQKLSKIAGTRISPTEFFTSPTAEQLSERIAKLLEEQGAMDVSKSEAGVPKTENAAESPVDEPFPLTEVQYAYWVGRSAGVELGNVSCHTYFELEGENIDLARLERAWNAVVKRHEMLRCVFLPEGLQKILVSVPEYSIVVQDLTGLESLKRDTKLAATRARMETQVHEGWPLFELSASQLPDEKTLLHISLDLLVADFHSITILMSELEKLYLDEHAQLPPLNFTFKEYVAREKALREEESYRKAKEYWKSRLKSLPPAPALPIAVRPERLGTPKFKKIAGKVAPELWKELRQKAKDAGTTPSCMLLSVYAELLARWSGSERFCINLTLFNRRLFHEDVMSLIGDFTSTSLLEVEHDSTTPFRERIQALQTRFWQDIEHRDYSGVQVIRDLHSLAGSTPGALMPVVFTANIGARKIGEMSAALGKIVFNASQTPQVWLDYQVFEEDEGLTVMWDYVDGLFPPGMLESMFQANMQALERIAKEAGILDQSLVVELSDLQKAKRTEYNNTKRVLPDGLLHGPLYSESSKFRLLYKDKVYSLKQIRGAASETAHQLGKSTSGANLPSGVSLRRGPEQIAALLGILMAGSSYVPLASTLPEARRIGILQIAGAKAAIVENGQKVPENVAALDIPTVSATPQNCTIAIPECSAADTAYIIFTSGSTGVPKGVEITHAAAVNTIKDINERFSVRENDILLGVSELSFDLSVYDIFGALHSGAGLVLPEEELSREPSHWYDLISWYGVTIWNSAPQLMRMLVEYCEASNVKLPSLRLAMLSGDWIPTSLPGRIKALAPQCQVISLGGATEASIWSIYHPVEPEDANQESIPYGRPLSNQEIHVLDRAMRPAPEWVPGDIYIGGVGLAKGYLGDEDKTAASFVLDPASGNRLYRTGDLGCFLPTNEVEFLGRSDYQLKIRGHRIEPGEIEAALVKFTGIKAAIVVAFGGQKEDKRLFAYLAAGSNAWALDSNLLTAFLKERLPSYMIPSEYIVLEELPVTDNGKVDRKALPVPSAKEPARLLHAPSSPAEIQLAKLWENILACPVTDTGDDFFALGGDSLLAGRLVLQIRAAMGITIPLGAVFEHPTLGEMAMRLNNANGNNTTTVPEASTNELEALANLPADISVRQTGKAGTGLGRVFLTGVTGFFGGAILEKLIAATNSKIFCLVRADDETEATERLCAAMRRRGCEKLPLERLQAVPGRLELPFFGLSQERFEKLAESIDTVIHCGANVQYAQPLLTMYPVNIGGTLTALRLACSDKNQARFIHVSTSTVLAGAEGVISGATTLRHGGMVSGGYAQSKWVAERILQKARKKGLDLTVFRPGTVSGDSRNGFWNREDFPCRFAMGCVDLGLAPELDKNILLLPVDIAAEALVRMSLDPTCSGKDWNMIPNKGIRLDSCVSAASGYGIRLKTVPLQEWKETLLESCLKESGNPLEPLLPLFPSDFSQLPPAPNFDSHDFLSMARRCGVDIPEISGEILGRYISFIFLQKNEKPAKTAN